MKIEQFAATMILIVATTGWNAADAQQGTAVGAPDQAGQAPRAQTLRSSPDAEATQDESRQGPTVSQAVVRKMQHVNDAEIELAKLAQQKSDNDDVKQLTKTIIKDHQSLNEKLQDMDSGRSDKPTSVERRGNTDPNRPTRGSARSNTRDKAARGGAEHVPKQLCEIAEQACQNALDMTKEMLSGKTGQDFDMGYLSHQIVAHTMVVAELKAIKSSGPEDLQQVVTSAIEKTEKHLKKAKEIAKRLEDKETPSS